MQRLFIIFIILLTFWHGLWGGVPRGDQPVYLHQISQLHDLGNILINAPSWNRNHALISEIILFRPVLYILMGSFYYFFGYNFILWQCASLFLHIMVVLGLHLLIANGSLRFTPYVFLLPIFFGVSLLGSELVLWHHAAGYILFSVFVVFSVYFLRLFFQTKNTNYGWFSLLLGILAEFTYELGVVINLLISLVFFYNYIFASAIEKMQIGKSTLSTIKWGLLFFLSALLYPLLSSLDLWLRGLNAPIGSQISLPHPFLATFYYTFIQLGFWIGGWIFPTTYDIRAIYRASFEGFKTISLPIILNFIVVLAILLFDLSRVRSAKLSFNNKAIVILPMVFLLVYSSVAAYGRTLPKGIEYLYLSIYYGYIAYLSIIVGIALFFLNSSNNVISDRNKIETNIIGIKKYKNYFSQYGLFTLIGIIALIGFNAYGVFTLAKSYRYNFAPSRQKVIDSITNWIDGKGKLSSAYFNISSNCKGNDLLPWFQEENGRLIRKNSGWQPPINLADALWPEKSFKLNKSMLAGKDIFITEIICEE